MSFTGGKLKLKGGDLKVAAGVKKKKKTSSDASAATTAADLAAAKALREGHALPLKNEEEDRRTEAEKKYDEHLKKVEAQRLAKLATKSHRERVKDFNEHLANLTEHYDIPKVGPG